MNNSPEAEAAVLGSMILEPTLAPEYIDKITDDYFTDYRNIDIFQAIKDLSGGHIDFVLIRDKIKAKGKTPDIDYMIQVAESVPSASSIDYYYKIIHRCTKERLADQVRTQEGPTNFKLLNQIQEELESMDVPKCPHVSEVIKEVKAFNPDYFKSTGFTSLDSKIIGWCPGLYVLAARPSMGKTGMMLDFVRHRLLQHDKVLVISMEMTRRSLLVRMTGAMAQVDTKQINTGIYLDSSDKDAVETARTGLGMVDLYVSDKTDMTCKGIRSIIRSVKPDIVFIDYLGLIRYSNSSQKDYQGVSAISRDLFTMTREFSLPIIVLHQLNRAPSGRADFKPRMSDLRDSGKIEQDADCILLIHREDYYRKDEPGYEADDKAMLIAEKVREGETGIVNLKFAKWWTSFSE